LADNYVEQNLQARWTATQKAADWLSQQLSGVKARLEKSEEHLQDYARRKRFGLSRIGQGTKPQRRERAGSSNCRKS